MPFNSKKFRKDIITKRCIENSMSMDEASKEIGISKATLSRIEKERMLEVDTFDKILTWLNKKPNQYFN